MLKEQITLVLGAAASHNVGFPLGKDLPRLIREDIENNARVYEYIFQIYTEQNALRYNIGNIREAIEEFQHDLIYCGTTIDEFISTNDIRRFLGKVGIFRVISSYENVEAFEVTTTEKKSNKDNDLERKWYGLIWQRVFEDCQSLTDFKKSISNLSVITFNYDRSFEQFLYTACISQFGEQNKEEIINIFSEFDIFHVYGQVGFLRYQESLFKKYYTDTNGEFYKYVKSYGPDIKNLHPEKILRYIKLINVFTDAHSDEKREEINSQIITTVRESKELFFLGFGYHKRNCQFFRDYDFKGKKYVINVIGCTTYKLGHRRIQKVQDLLDNTLGIEAHNEWILDMKNGDFVYNYFCE